jgi:Ser/Thr protein kinase RdoA (MazF antagonist)
MWSSHRTGTSSSATTTWPRGISSATAIGGFIDWDAAGPGSRLWDLAYAAHGFVPMIAGGDPGVDGPRLRALADGYGLDEPQRRALPALIGAHARGMFELLRTSSSTGRQPWARLWEEGHGDHWGPAADYIEEHVDTWTAALRSG